MSYDPNFPVDLAINPSNHLHSSPHLCSVATSGQSVFGSTAQLESIRKYGIAGRVWEASYPLLIYLGHDDWEFDPPFVTIDDSKTQLTILELGAGTGVVTSRLLDTVLDLEQDVIFSTDLPEVCPLLEANLKAVSKGTHLHNALRVRPLAWGNMDHAMKISDELDRGRRAHNSASRYLTHVVCSDLVYFPELLAPLLRTLIQLSSPPFVPMPAEATFYNGLTVIMSYKTRSLVKETAFWSAFGLWFTFEPVMARPNTTIQTTPQSSWRRFGMLFDDQTFVFVARRRPESFSWNVPSDDRELMSGVDAYGTKFKKADDTFETLLLMGMHDEQDE